MAGRQPYLGPAAKVGERVPYLGPHTSTTTRTPYLGGSAPTVKAPGHHGGGILGTIEGGAHWAAGKAGLAAHDLKTIPGGTVQLVSTAAQDVGARGGYELGLVSKKTMLRDVAKANALGEGYKSGAITSVEHPGRDPFQTLMTVAPLLHVAGEAGLRGAEVAKAGSIPEAAKALVTKAPIRPRLIRSGDGEVALHPTTNPAGRILQHAYDKVVQHQMDTNPEGKIAAHGQRRIGNANLETARYQERMRAAPANALEAAAKRLTRKGSPGQNRVSQAALELTSTNTHPIIAAAYHLEQAEKGVEAGEKLASGVEMTRDERSDAAKLRGAVDRNRTVAKLYQTVSEKNLLAKNERGDVIVNHIDHPKLAQADIALARVQGKGDAALVRYGVRTPEALQAAVDAPGRYRAGAHFEEPTPGKLGKPSAALLGARSQVARLQALHDRLTGKVAQETAKAARPEDAVIGSKVVGPGALKGRTPAEAQARLDVLEKEHNKALDTLAAARLGPVDRAEVVRRNVENARAARQASGRTRSTTSRPAFSFRDEAHARRSIEIQENHLAGEHLPGDKSVALARAELAAAKEYLRTGKNPESVTTPGRASGASGRKSVLKQSVVEERRAQAEAIAEKAIADHPDHPTSKAWRARTDEIDALRSGLNPMIFEDADKALLGKAPKGPGRVVGTHSGPRAERIGAALSVAKDRLAAMEAAAAGRVQPTGIIGGEAARPGRGHVSYTSTEKRAPQSPVAASPGPVIGEAKAPITSHANKGENIAHGLVPADITGQSARHYRSILRFVNTTERRNAAIKTGVNVRRSNRDVLVKVPGADHAKISQAVEEVLGKSKPTVDEINGLNAALDAYREDLVPGLADKFAADAEHPVGTTAAEAAKAQGLDAPGGYKWVDRGALGDLAKKPPEVRGKAARSADNINSAVTAATVYFKIGHFPQRVLTNTVTTLIQGAAGPFELARSVKLWKQLSPEDRSRALGAAGQHGYDSMPHNEGVGAISHFVGGRAKSGSNWWAKHADAPFRFASIAYEARKAGFDTPARFRAMLDQLENPHGLDAAQTAKLEWVPKRANRSGIAYDRLNNFEQRYITRAVWFYPWLKGATVFAGHTFVEHPYKSAVIGSAGVQGRKTQEKALGALPDYEQGLLSLGGGARPLVTDPSSLTPFSTPANVLDAAARPGELSGFLNPLYGSTDQLINGVNSFGSKTNTPVSDALGNLASPTPEAQIFTAWLHRHQNQSNRMFETTPKSAFLRALVGASMPRRINAAAAHSSAARQTAGR